jgi:Caspase domain/TIR domain
MTPFDAHALVIGVSAYQHISPLSPKPDAQDMATVLADPALCAYPKENVRVLLQEEATRERILEELGALAQRTSEQSTVFFYFSGHGGLARVKGAETCYLMPVGARAETLADLNETAISGSALSALLRAIPASKVTVVLDCCNAAGVAEPRDVAAPVPVLTPRLSPASVEVLAQGIGRAVLAASRADGSAFAMPDARNGIFTGHLLAGLRGGAVGVGGVIRICDLFHYVQERTRAEYQAQRPVFKAEIEDNYPVALFRGGAAPALVLPTLGDGYQYDAFVSCGKADAEWVRRTVVPSLELLGLKLCLEDRDFRLGAQRLKEMERAVKTSRYTVCLFTPAYLTGPFEDFQQALARFQAAESGQRRFIPLLRQRCEPSMGVQMTQLLDVTDDRDVPAALQRLALALRESPADVS